jgi:hypothetical protein
MGPFFGNGEEAGGAGSRRSLATEGESGPARVEGAADQPYASSGNPVIYN